MVNRSKMPVPSNPIGRRGGPRQNETNNKLEKAIVFLSHLDAAMAREDFPGELRKIKEDLLEEIERNARNYHFDPELYQQAKALMQKALQRNIVSEGNLQRPKKVQFDEEDDAREYVLGDTPHAGISGGKSARNRSVLGMSSASAASARGVASAMPSSDWVDGFPEFDRMTNLVFGSTYNQGFIEAVTNFFVYNQDAEHSAKGTIAGKALLETLNLGSKVNEDKKPGLFRPGCNPTEKALFSIWRARLIANFAKQRRDDVSSQQKKSINIAPPVVTTQETRVLKTRIKKLQGLANDMLGKLESMGAIEGFIDHPDASKFIRTTREHLPAEGRIIIFRRNWKPEAEDKAVLLSFTSLLARYCLGDSSHGKANSAFDCALRRQQWLYSDIGGQLYDELSDDGDKQEDRSRLQNSNKEATKPKLQDGYNMSDLSADSRYCPETAEAWFADMPPYFPWGETPYARILISRQINEDLAEGKKAMATPRPAHAETRSSQPQTSASSKSLLSKGISYLSRRKNRPEGQSAVEIPDKSRKTSPTRAAGQKRRSSERDDVEESEFSKKKKRA